MLNIPAGWKPIESAPKDGTEILAWRSDCGQFIASYTSADSFPMTQDELDAWDEETLFAKDWFTQWPQAYRLEGIEVPTHWMPLPAAPGSVSPSAPGDAQDGDRMTVLYVAGAICRHLDMALDQSKVMAAARDIAQHIAAPAAGDALDAARYRWLRDNIQEDHSLPGSFWLSDTGGESWDKTIDAAMAYQRQQGEAA